jgi:hypothetical protein
MTITGAAVAKAPEVAPGVPDLAYEVYQARQHSEVRADTLADRVGEIRPGGKFRLRKAGWQPCPYPGVAVVSMLDEAPENADATRALRKLQCELHAGVAAPEKLCPLPVPSFHQTMANTFSDRRYAQFVAGAGLHEAFPRMLAEAMASVPGAVAPEPIRMHLIGLSVFRTAIGLLGEFPDPGDYERIIAFRESVYDNPALSRMGLRRTRPFIGHVTLAYFEARLSEAEKARLVRAASDINRGIAQQPVTVTFTGTSARWYDDLSAFQAPQHYPSFTFVGSRETRKECRP